MSLKHDDEGFLSGEPMELGKGMALLTDILENLRSIRNSTNVQSFNKRGIPPETARRSESPGQVQNRNRGIDGKFLSKTEAKPVTKSEAKAEVKQDTLPENRHDRDERDRKTAGLLSGLTKGVVEATKIAASATMEAGDHIGDMDPSVKALKEVAEPISRVTAHLPGISQVAAMLPTFSGSTSSASRKTINNPTETKIKEAVEPAGRRIFAGNKNNNGFFGTLRERTATYINTKYGNENGLIAKWMKKIEKILREGSTYSASENKTLTGILDALSSSSSSGKGFFGRMLDKLLNSLPGKLTVGLFRGTTKLFSGLVSGIFKGTTGLVRGLSGGLSKGIVGLASGLSGGLIGGVKGFFTGFLSVFKKEDNLLTHIQKDMAATRKEQTLHSKEEIKILKKILDKIGAAGGKGGARGVEGGSGGWLSGLGAAAAVFAVSAARTAYAMGKALVKGVVKSSFFGAKWALGKAASAGGWALEKAKTAGGGALEKAKTAGGWAYGKAKTAGGWALEKAKTAGGGVLSGAKSLGRGLLKRIPILATLLEAGTAAFDIFGTEKDKKLSRREKDQKNGSSVGGAAGALVGMTALALVGQIGGPIGIAIGTAVGAWLGSDAGKIVGDAIGGWINDLRNADIPGMLKSNWNSFTKLLGKNWSAVATAMGAAWDATAGKAFLSIADYFKYGWDKVSVVWNKMWADVAADIRAGWATIVATFTTGKDAVKGAAGWVGRKAASLWSSIAGEKLPDDLGSVSAKFESNNAGPGSVSKTGGQDGTSYGKHQLSSKQGTVQEFLNNSPYGAQFAGLEPGSDAFNKKWEETGKNDPNFGKAQHDFIAETHYQPVMDALQKDGFDTSKFGRAEKESVWSTAVQFRGNAPALYHNAFEGKDKSKLTGAEFVSGTQDYKTANNERLFKSSTPEVRASTLQRSKDEKIIDLELAAKDKLAAAAAATAATAAAATAAAVAVQPTLPTSSSVPPVVVSAPIPSAVSVSPSPAQKIPPPPPIETPLNTSSADTRQTTVINNTSDVAQDVSDRWIAHIVTGGMSA